MELPKTTVLEPTCPELLRPRNPRHRPHKSHDEHCQCNPGRGVHVAVLLGSDNLYTTPFEIPFLIRSSSWWRYMVGGPLELLRHGASGRCVHIQDLGTQHPRSIGPIFRPRLVACSMLLPESPHYPSSFGAGEGVAILTNFFPTDKKFSFFLDVGNFYCCRLQIPLILGWVILPNLPTSVFVCLLKAVTCLPSLPSE